MLTQREARLSSDPASIEKLESLLKQIQVASQRVRATIKKIPTRINPTDKGLSLFQVKNACLATYLTSLGHLICSKFEGKSIVNLPIIHLLIQMRIIIEKIKPIESKLKYRIDKLLKSLNKHSVQDDALSHKPNLAAFQDTSSDDDDAQDYQMDSSTIDASAVSSAADDQALHTMKKARLYRPPKLTAVKYDDGDTRLPPKRFSKNLLRELKDEFSEAPEVQVDTPEILDEAFQERQQFEEAHFTRLNVSKKEKRRLSKPKSMGDELRSLLKKDE